MSGGEREPVAAAGRWRQLALLTLAVFAGTFARVALSPLQETVRGALAFSDTQMALLQGPALSLPFVLASLPLGLLIDRRSRARIMLALVAMCAAGGALTALAPGFGWLLAARCLVGFAALAMNTVTLAIIADLFAPAQRGRALTIMGLGQIVGSSAAFALGGALAARWGADPEGWRSAMFWLSLPVGLVLVPLLALREPHRLAARARPSLGEGLRLLWGMRGVVLPLLFGEIMFQVIFKAVIVWGAPSLARAYAAPPDQTGAVMASALFISGLVGPLLGGLLADLAQRGGGARRTALATGITAALSIPAGAFALLPGIGMAAVVLALFMSLVSAIAIMGTSLFTIQVPEAVRGLGASLLVGASILFGGIAPVLISLLGEALGGEARIGAALAITCAATGLAGALLYLGVVRRLPAAGEARARAHGA